MRLLLLALLIPLAFCTREATAADASAEEFILVGKKVVQYLRDNEIEGVDVAALEAAVSQTRVESTDQKLRLNGVPKDAINYPTEGRILFNRKRWQSFDAGEKPVLVLHEYLGILDVDDASYRLSKKLLGAFTYGMSADLRCTLDGGHGSLNLGIEESAGADFILMGATLDRENFTAQASLPTGEFSRMLRDGNFSLSLKADVEEEGSASIYLLSVQSHGRRGSFTGHFAVDGKVYPVKCKIKKLDLSRLER